MFTFLTTRLAEYTAARMCDRGHPQKSGWEGSKAQTTLN